MIYFVTFTKQIEGILLIENIESTSIEVYDLINESDIYSKIIKQLYLSHKYYGDIIKILTINKL